jgi:hypothetical protein
MIPAARRTAIYLLSAALWLTGGLWLIFHHFMHKTDQFGFDGADPLERWWLIAHAVVGFWSIWMFGVLWSGHIKSGWRTKTRWISGGGLFLVVVWLVLTGVSLYYLSSDEWRKWTSLAHWIPGLAAVAVFLFHAPRRFTFRNPPSPP